MNKTETCLSPRELYLVIQWIEDYAVYPMYSRVSVCCCCLCVDSCVSNVVVCLCVVVVCVSTVVYPIYSGGSLLLLFVCQQLYMCLFVVVYVMLHTSYMYYIHHTSYVHTYMHTSYHHTSYMCIDGVLPCVFTVSLLVYS